MRWGARNYTIKTLHHNGQPVKVFYNAEGKRFKLTDNIGFGKYGNKSISTILSLDRSYMKWMLSAKQSNRQFFIALSPDGYEYIFRHIFLNIESQIDDFYLNDYDAARRSVIENNLSTAIHEMKLLLKGSGNE